MPPTDNSIVGGIGQGGPSQVSWLGQLMDQFAFDWDAAKTPPQHAVKGVSQAMEEVLGLISQVARVRVNVMIYGKRGTEKKSVAKTIHNRSTRGDKSFFDINCRGLAEHLLEAELFGHERGIFADAKNLKRGLLELSDGGTVFLDEIGDMPLTVQHKFTRVLESRTFRRIGGTQDISVDFRVIAGTDRDLKQGVEEGTFREDLYYRLNVVQITLPDLKDRQEDIPLLVKHLVQKFAQELSPAICEISEEAMGVLVSYPWPGNVRELENVIERAVALTTGNEIRVESLPPSVRKTPPPPVVPRLEVPPQGLNLEQVVAELEKSLMQDALQKAGGVQTKAAELLGINFRSFRYRVQKYGL